MTMTMGIPKLTSFIRQLFSCWKEEEIKGYLVIDGDSLCYLLYDTLDWTHGGQYLEYRDHVLECFRAIQSSAIKPIVVFDGIDYTGAKSETLVKRHGNRFIQILDQFYTLPA